MDHLKKCFEKLIVKKKNVTRSDVIEVKHRADHCNAKISSALAHILEGTNGKLVPQKIKQINDLYKRNF